MLLKAQFVTLETMKIENAAMLLMFSFELEHLKNALLPAITVLFVNFTSVLCLEFSSLSQISSFRGHFVWQSGQGSTVSAYSELKIENGETPVVLMKTALESVTRQEEVHNTVAEVGPKSHLLYVTVTGGHRYWTKIFTAV